MFGKFGLGEGRSYGLIGAQLRVLQACGALPHDTVLDHSASIHLGGYRRSSISNSATE